MKKIILLISLVLALGLNALSQNIDTDFVVLDISCPNSDALKAQYKGQTNAYVVTASQILAPSQITTAIKGKKITDLHIFVWSKPGSMVFTSIALTPENIQEYVSLLATWKSHITGKVIVHSSDVFTDDRGLDFKSKLEQSTGLTFIMQ